MKFNIFADFIKPIEFKPLPKPAPKPPAPAPQVLTNDGSAQKAQLDFVGANNKTKLEKQLALTKPTPDAALESINRLPKPDLTGTAAIRNYKTQRAKAADDAIKNSVPPNRQDYLNSGLNGATASYEYEQAKSSYDSQIGALKKVSDEAKRNPDKIISPYDATTQINNLPAPDRGNPQSVQAYNKKRAQIADDALMYAAPPKFEDFLKSGLNGRTASYEYEQAKTYYDGAVKQLKEYSGMEWSSSLLTPQAETAASASADKLSKYINDNQLGNIEDTNTKIAAEINGLKVQYGDEAAAKMMAELYKKNPDDLFVALRLTDKMPAGDRQNIGRALGDGYGYLSAGERADFAKRAAETVVLDSFTTNANFGKSTTLGELLACGGNTQMKTDVVKALMDKAATIQPKLLGDNGGVDVQALFKSAALIADSAPPADSAAMLKNIVETLPKINLPSLVKDNETKDLLSKLFMDSGAQFLHSVAPDGALSSAGVRDGMIKLMELTLFSEGANSLRPKMMEYMVKLTKDVGDAAGQPPISQSAYEKSHGGWSQQDHVEVMSSLMAITWKAAGNQKDAIKSDQEQQKETIQMFTGLAFSFVPGAGKVLGELGGEGAGYLEKISDKVRDFAWDKAKSAAQSGVENGLGDLLSGDSLNDIDKMMGSLRETVLSLSATLPNGEQGELNLRTTFEAAFAYYQLI